MLTDKEMINELKGELYDIIGFIHTKSREQIFNLLCKTLKQCLQVKYVGVFLYDDLRKERKLQSFDQGRPLYFNALLTDEFYTNKMKNQLEEHVVLPFASFTDEKNSNTFVLRIKPARKPNGFVLLSDVHSKFTLPCLKEITLAVNQFFNFVNEYIYDLHIQKQNTLLLDFSSKIYSLYNMKDILKIVIVQLNEVYPQFSHQLFLSQDYEQDSSLPIKTIDYSHEKKLAADTRAFINGTLEIEYNKEKSETNIYTPLNGNQGIYGVIKTTIPVVTKSIDEEIQFLKKFAHIIGQSIESTSLYQSSNRLVSDLQMINEASHKLNSNLEKSEIINTLKKQIIDSCYATEVGFLKYDRENSYVINDGSTPFFKTERNHKFIKKIFNEILKRETSMFYGDFSEVYKLFPFQSVMVIPMQVSDYFYGTTVVMHENGYFFSFEKFKFIESLVQHATLALMNTSLKEELEQTVITDYLTKLYSRNYLDEAVGKHMEEDKQGVFILFDVDDFKLINDTYGHSVGDQVLIQIANILQNNIPESGFAARWGGEEFAMYIRHVSLEEGILLANKIREEATQLTDPKVTISSGIAYWIEMKEDSVKDVFIRADKALYQAKATGKNKIVTERELKEV